MIKGIVRLLVGLSVLGALFWLLVGGKLLVRDAPERSDAIIALDGEYDVRIQRALQLLRQGYGQHLFLDVVDATIYGQHSSQIARQFIDSLPPGDRARIHLCPMRAHSTKEEARAVIGCLQSVGAHRVVIATSDYHTYRSLLIFRHEAPQFSYSVAAAPDPDVYGAMWWQHRQWAKYYFTESVRLLWFEVVDRWR